MNPLVVSITAILSIGLVGGIALAGHVSFRRKHQ